MEIRSGDYGNIIWRKSEVGKFRWGPASVQGIPGEVVAESLANSSSVKGTKNPMNEAASVTLTFGGA